MSKISVIFIDPGTSGVSSEYLNAYRLTSVGWKIRAIGNYWSNGDFIEKLFFKYSDLHAKKKIRNTIVRYLIRYIEYVFGLFFVTLISLRNRPRALVFALSLGRESIWEFFFLGLICRLVFRIPLSIVCHDVVPFGLSNSLGWKIRILYRRLLFNFSDSIIVHNDSGRAQLRKIFGVKNKMIRIVPFPVMDISTYHVNSCSVATGNLDSDGIKKFLVIGGYRPEKGFDLLLDAWRLYREANPRSVNILTIAGYGFPVPFLIRCQSLPGVIVINNYLSDAEYVSIMRAADILILPYLRGTNSGPLSNAISLQLPVICTPISMFRRCGLVPDYSLCADLSAVSLAKKINLFANASISQRDSMLNDLLAIQKQRNYAFSSAVELWLC